MYDKQFSKRHEKHMSSADERYVCTSIAVEMAAALQARGANPQILALRARQQEEGRYIMLRPKPYEGRVAWGAHIICIWQNEVYDPIFNQPLPLEEYLSRAFDQEVDIEDCTHLLYK